MMRSKVKVAVALALAALTIPSAGQAHDYGHGGHRYSYAGNYGRYNEASYERGANWREHRRWERHRARAERRAYRRWLRAHRHHHGDYAWNRYR